MAEALCRIPTSRFNGKEQLRSDEIYEEPMSDMLVVLVSMMGKSWAGEEIGGEVKGLPKSDVRTVSILVSSWPQFEAHVFDS